jgi:hypothetical protein
VSQADVRGGRRRAFVFGLRDYGEEAGEERLRPPQKERQRPRLGFSLRAW